MKFGVEGISQLSENLAGLVNSDSKDQDKSEKEDSETTNNETEKNNNQDSESINNEDANNFLNNFLNNSLNNLLKLLGVSGSVAGMGKLLGIIKNLIGDDKMDLTQYLQSPDYEKEAAFIEKFHEDFSKIVRAYVGKNEKIYVFIDDLDRCELGKSADLLQGLNMMISNDPNLIFILGMDREKVAASITFKQKDVIPFLASIAKENQEWENRNDRSIKQVDYGFSFLEKFVQLSFSVPESSPNTLNNFLEKGSEAQIKIETDEKKDFFWIPHSLIAKTFDIPKRFKDAKLIVKELREKIFNRSSSPKEEPKTEVEEYPILEQSSEFEETEVSYPELPIFPVIEKDLEPENLANLIEIVAPFFDNNPRRFKQYVNALTLKIYIAYYSIGVTFDEKQTITIEQMGKFTALTLKYPRLLFELKNNNQLLAELEKFAIDQSPGLNNSIMPLKDKGSASYWINNYPKIQQLLCSKMTSNN
ncbi:P-loop NTPase fold protein, partial [Hydrocoleum sp. CS-953]|uniref:P-loop NTPase fold protein n=1 Tax=Hydrocoleum sp. CS-953 TaxID=1671698 RepID=UPI001FEDA9A0